MICHRFNKFKKKAELQLFTPKPTYRILGTPSKNPEIGKNPLAGMIIDYYLPDLKEGVELKLDIYQGDQLLRSYSSIEAKDFKSWSGGPSKPMAIPAKKGFNRTSWDLRRMPIEAVDKLFVLGDYRGGFVAPGNYRAQLTYGNETAEVALSLLADPMVEASSQAYLEQHEFLGKIQENLTQIHHSVNQMREVQSQLQSHLKVLSKNEKFNNLKEQGETIAHRLKDWEEQLIQPQQKTFQDVINFKNKLNAEFMYLKDYVNSAEPKVTQGAKERLSALESQWNAHQRELDALIQNEIHSFNEAFKALHIPALWIENK